MALALWVAYITISVAIVVILAFPQSATLLTLEFAAAMLAPFILMALALWWFLGWVAIRTIVKWINSR